VEADLAVPQWILAACCVVIGVAPLLVLPAAVRTAGLLIPGGAAGAEALAVTGTGPALSALSAGMIALAVLLWAGRSLAMARRPRGSSPTWSCAYPGTSSRMQYTASSFASPLLVTFGPASGIHRTKSPGASETHPVEWVLDRLALPLWKRLLAVAGRLGPLQAAGMRWYLLYSVLCLLGLLLYLRFLAVP
jgi:hypothetical protein